MKVAVSLTAAAALVLAGCGERPITTPDVALAEGGLPVTEERLVQAFADRSQSTADQAVLEDAVRDDQPGIQFEQRQQLRTKTIEQVLALGKSLDPKLDHLMLFRYGSVVREVYSGSVGDADAFSAQVLDALSSSDPVAGTDYPAVIERAADVAEDALQDEIVVLILGDGFHEGQYDDAQRQRYHEAAQRLLANERVKLIRFWGVGHDEDTGFSPREEIREAFQGHRGRLQILSDGQGVLD